MPLARGNAAWLELPLNPCVYASHITPYMSTVLKHRTLFIIRKCNSLISDIDCPSRNTDRSCVWFIAVSQMQTSYWTQEISYSLQLLYILIYIQNKIFHQLSHRPWTTSISQLRQIPCVITKAGTLDLAFFLRNHAHNKRVLLGRKWSRYIYHEIYLSSLINPLLWYFILLFLALINLSSQWPNDTV